MKNEQDTSLNTDPLKLYIEQATRIPLLLPPEKKLLETVHNPIAQEDSRNSAREKYNKFILNEEVEFTPEEFLLLWYDGVFSQESWTLDKISKIFGMTRKTVRQITANMLRIARVKLIKSKRIPTGADTQERILRDY